MISRLSLRFIDARLSSDNFEHRYVHRMKFTTHALSLSLFFILRCLIGTMNLMEMMDTMEVGEGEADTGRFTTSM